MGWDERTSLAINERARDAPLPLGRTVPASVPSAKRRAHVLSGARRWLAAIAATAAIVFLALNRPVLHARLFGGCSEYAPDLALSPPQLDVVTSSWTGVPPRFHGALLPRGDVTSCAGGKPCSIAATHGSSNSPLFAILDRSALTEAVSSGQAHLTRLLSQVYGWQLFNGTADGIFAESLARFGRAPDIVLILETEWLLASIVAARTQLGPVAAHTKLWLYADDPHWHPATAADSLSLQASRVQAMAAADRVLSTVGYVFPAFFPGLPLSKVYWHPHSAALEFVQAFNGSPLEKVLLSGMFQIAWYPARAHVMNLMEAGDTRFDRHQHPGYFNKNFFTSRPFRSRPQLHTAEVMNRYLACITDGSSLSYTVAKVFEITATGCLLLMEASVAEPMLWLGFQPGVHYLPYTKESLSETVDRVLDPLNRASVDAVRRSGQMLTLTRHLITHRASTLHEAAVRAARSAFPLPNVSVYDSIDVHGAIVQNDAGKPWREPWASSSSSPQQAPFAYW